MQSINDNEDVDFMINKTFQHKIMLTANISQKLIMTDACNYKIVL